MVFKDQSIEKDAALKPSKNQKIVCWIVFEKSKCALDNSKINKQKPNLNPLEVLQQSADIKKIISKYFSLK